MSNENFCTLVHGIIKLHFSPILTKYLPLSPCILLHCIFHSSHLLMASFTPNYLLAFRTGECKLPLSWSFRPDFFGVLYLFIPWTCKPDNDHLNTYISPSVVCVINR